MNEPLTLPDIGRPDAGSIVTSTWQVGTRERQRAAADVAMATWKRLPWPEACLSLNCFLSTDGKLVWFYAQWTHEDAHRAFAATQRNEVAEAVDRAVPDIQRLGVIRSRLYKSFARDEGIFPGCIVLVTIATDGPERQVQFFDTVLSHVTKDGGLRDPGGLGAHFHFSTDGTRVLNVAEWTSEQAHREALETGVLSRARQVIEAVPGIQGIGFDRYHLYRRLVKPAP